MKKKVHSTWPIQLTFIQIANDVDIEFKLILKGGTRNGRSNISIGR